jgi:hypothetical protein
MATFTKLPNGTVKLETPGQTLWLKPRLATARPSTLTSITLAYEDIAPGRWATLEIALADVTAPAGPWADAEALCDELNGNYFFDTAGGGAPSSELVANSLTLDPATAPAPTATQVALAQVDVGRRMLGLFTSDGRAKPMQPFWGTSRIGLITVFANNSFGYFGILTMTNTGFTAVPRAMNTASLLARMRRVGMVTSATAATVGQLRVQNNQLAISDGTYGGFFFSLRFGISDAAPISDARMFMGLRPNNTPANVSPTTLTDCIGMGHDAGDATMSIYYGNATPATPIVLPAAFATTAGIPYQLVLYAPSGTAGACIYQVTRLDTGDVAQGVITTGLPADSTLMHFWGYRTNNASPLAAAIDFVQLYIETEY